MRPLDHQFRFYPGNDPENGPAVVFVVTELERDVLAGIYASEYSDGPLAEPWSWSIRAKVATKAQIPGVVASLVKKGLVRSNGMGKEASVGVTERGYHVAVALGIRQAGEL